MTVAPVMGGTEPSSRGEGQMAGSRDKARRCSEGRWQGQGDSPASEAIRSPRRR